MTTLLGTALRGLRARLLLTFGSILLILIAVAAAVVGPMYQSASSASFLVSEVRAEPGYRTGLSVDYTPAFRMREDAAIVNALGFLSPAVTDHFDDPEASLWTTRHDVDAWDYNGLPSEVTLVTQLGICDRLDLTGTCPHVPGEIAMLAADAAFRHLAVGDSFDVAGIGPLTLVGTYQVRSADDWFDPTRLTSYPPQPPSGFAPAIPYRPAPLIASSSTVLGLPPGNWMVRLDYALSIPATTTIDDLTAAEAAVKQATREAKGQPGLTIRPGNDLTAIVDTARERQATAGQTVTPVVLSLILVSLVLLARLMASATDLRRPEIALASLRGLTGRSLWLLAMVEPSLILLVSTPLGVVAGYLGARRLGATWLVSGLPMPLSAQSVWFAVGVVAASFAVAALAVRVATNETLAQQLVAVRRPANSTRRATILRSAAIAIAVALLAVTLLGGRHGKQDKPDAADLFLPIALAVAAGLVTTLLATAVARWWARRSESRRGMASYLAARTVARRREGTWVVLPLTAALGIAVFAAGVFSAAASWRASEAATVVGADQSYQVSVPLADAVSLTHRLDPDGRWLMAAGVDLDAHSSKLILDAPRLTQVGAWPSSWTPDMSVDEVSTALSPTGPPLVLTGRQVSLTVDNEATDAERPLTVSLDLVAPYGQAHHIYLGPYKQGLSTHDATTAYCENGCIVKDLAILSSATEPERLDGTVALSGLQMDGTDVSLGDVGWRPGMPADPSEKSPVTSVAADGSTVTATLDSGGSAQIAVLSPTDVTPLPAVLVGRGAAKKTPAHAGDVLTVPADVTGDVRLSTIGESESMPFVGPSGYLVDYTSYTRYYQVFDSQTDVYVLARDDTPKSVIDKLGAAGITERQSLDDARTTLDQDPYALALNLYLVVTVVVIALAIAGLAVAMAVQLPSRRRDAASLRVVGVRRRSIALAGAIDATAVLGAAALAGIIAGAISQYVVVRTLTLGFADSALVPRVVPSIDLAVVGAVVAATFAVLLALAVVIGVLTIRGGRTSTLREDAG